MDVKLMRSYARKVLSREVVGRSTAVFRKVYS
jgi:hypothetical protein